jgi:hypothetical protein
MTPNLTYLAAQAHIDDLHRDARRHHRHEEARRQMIRIAPPRHVIRRPRLAAVASQH